MCYLLFICSAMLTHFFLFLLCEYCEHYVFAIVDFSYKNYLYLQQNLHSNFLGYCDITILLYRTLA